MFEVIIQNKIQETPNIASFELVRADGQAMPLFETGSHIDVHISDAFTRQYSLINHSRSNEFYKIAVLNDANSRGGSVALHKNFNVGDRLTISAPRNLFPLNVNSDKVMLFAGGIGITPIMSMAIELDSLGVDFELHYHTRSKQDTAFYQQLSSSPFSSKVFFYFDGVPEAKGHSVESALASFTDNTHLYTCGPGGYMDYIFSTAQSLHWKTENLHKEVFQAQPKPTESGDKPFKLILSRSGIEIDVDVHQSALEAIEDAGVDIDMSCEMGICGACLTTVIEGQPDHRDEFLTADEKSKNNQFTPCCSRALSDSLTIDL
ncbi:PDR/VanB family oxidoreductase [Neptunomonas phycophila]|uniref:PDR/VanB family oxidoreductase n=1 Tax=Neptunomonas phycophila TaxID=1572645 RepID=UPI003734FD34